MFAVIVRLVLVLDKGVATVLFDTIVVLTEICEVVCVANITL